MKPITMAVRVLSVILLAESVSSLSLSLGNTPSNEIISSNRRTALAHLATVPSATVAFTSSILTFSNPATATASDDAASSTSSPVCTVVVGSPDAAPNVGLQLSDIKININDSINKEVPSVESVESGSIAAASGVKPGMILLGKDSATKASSVNVNFRIRNGPYPFVMQFATQEEMMNMSMARKELQVQERLQKEGAERVLDPYGPLKIKKGKTPVTSSDGCTISAKRGDTITILYEARIGSSTGPLYDSTAWRQGKPSTFELGKGFAIPGIEIGLNGMCVGEVREINVPTQLGYGRYGSQVFDIPGDVRLWWKVEMLDLNRPEGSVKSNWRFK